MRVERGMVRVEYHAQAHITMSLTRARTLESSAVTMRPPRGLNLTNLGGLTRQSNAKADKQIKMVNLQFVDFPLW